MVTGFLAAFLFLGMLLAGAASHPILPKAGAYLVEGVVAEDVKLKADGKAAGYLEDVTVTGEAGEYSLAKVYWTYYYDEEKPFLPLDGQKVRFQAALYHPSGQTNPYGFDFRMFLLQKGVIAGVSGVKEAEVIETSCRGLSSVFYRINQCLSRKVQEIFGEGSALPDALLLGNKEHLPQEVQDSYSSAGVAHVLSVSGLHVGLLAAVLQWITRKWLSPKGRFAVLTGFLLIYCGLLNFSAPVVRASLILIVGGIRRIVRRAPDRLTTLAAAFLLILLSRPLDLFSASFQLSFGAVLGIVMLGPALEKIFIWIKRKSFRDAVTITLSATGGAILPAVQIFHRFSLIGIGINPVVCWIFGLMLPVYAAVLIMGGIYLPLGQAAALPVNWIAERINQGIQWMGDLSFASISLPSLPWYVICAVVFVLLLCTGYVIWPARRKLALGAAALMLSLFGWHFSICTDVQYWQLEMGQADGAVILDGRETILIDTGEYGGDMVSYLLAAGRSADHIILTHLHTDHMGGMDEILAADIPIGEVILPEGAFDQDVGQAAFALKRVLEDRNIPIRFWAAGDEMKTKRMVITALWPEAGTVRPGHDANRYGLALLCELDGVTLFSAGELSGAFEHYAARDADILKVAHHGSKNGTGETFLSMVSPSAALITGNGSNKTLPHPETLERLDRAGVLVYNTGELGAVHIRIHDGQALLTPYLSQGEKP